MHTQVGYRGVHEVTPSPTNMRELAPLQLDIPGILVIQSIVVEYAQEYIILERIDSRIMHAVPWSLGCWRRGR